MKLNSTNLINTRQENKKTKFNYLFCLYLILYIFIIFNTFQNISKFTKYLFYSRYFFYAFLFLLLSSNILLGYRKGNLSNKKIIYIILFIGYFLVIFFFTYIRYNFNTALRSLFWYLQSPILALITPFIITDLKQAKLIIRIWLSVCVIGALSIVYQYLGGELPWEIIEETRAGITRFSSTLHSDPNLSGTVSSIVFTFSVFFVRSIIWKVVLILSAVVLFFSAVSKAGFLCFIIAIGLIFVLSDKISLVKNKFTLKRTLYLSAALLILFILVSFTEIDEEFKEAGHIIISSVTGTGERRGTLNIYEEIVLRTSIKPKQGIELLISKSDFPVRDIIVGGSFGLIRRGEDRLFRPHNSFLEIFLSGGIIHLLLFIIIIIMTIIELYKKSYKNNFYKSLLITFIILVSYLPGFPVYTTIPLSPLFWLIIGLSANNRLNTEKKCF